MVLYQATKTAVLAVFANWAAKLQYRQCRKVKKKYQCTDSINRLRDKLDMCYKELSVSFTPPCKCGDRMFLLSVNLVKM